MAYIYFDESSGKIQYVCKNKDVNCNYPLLEIDDSLYESFVNCTVRLDEYFVGFKKNKPVLMNVKEVEKKDVTDQPFVKVMPTKKRSIDCVVDVYKRKIRVSLTRDLTELEKRYYHNVKGLKVYLTKKNDPSVILYNFSIPFNNLKEEREFSYTIPKNIQPFDVLVENLFQTYKLRYK